MKFNFKAKNKAGEIRTGSIEAANAEVAAEVIQKNELFPISIQEEKIGGELALSFMKYFEKVTQKELMVFFRQLAILIEARVPINASLLAIKDQTYNNYFRKVIGQVINDIQDGYSISDALSKHQDVFSGFSINIVKAGEVSGNLRKSIEYVADNIEKNYKLTSKIRSAMMYPVIVLIVFFIIAFIIVSFVIPKLTLVIKEVGTDVPWYTQLVIMASDFMATYWWAVAIVIFGFIGGALYYVNTEEGKREWDRVKINLPVFGPIFRYIYMARFADNLAVLLAGGIPIIRALTIVSSVVNNSLYQGIFLKAADEVKIGGNMSDVFKTQPLIPPIVSQMIKIGEESGQIDTVLMHVAKFYEQEADEQTKNLSTLIEPIMMIIIGVAVGFLAVAVIMPIYDIAGRI